MNNRQYLEVIVTAISSVVISAGHQEMYRNKACGEIQQGLADAEVALLKCCVRSFGLVVSLFADYSLLSTQRYSLSRQVGALGYVLNTINDKLAVPSELNQFQQEIIDMAEVLIERNREEDKSLLSLLYSILWNTCDFYKADGSGLNDKVIRNFLDYNVNHQHPGLIKIIEVFTEAFTYKP